MHTDTKREIEKIATAESVADHRWRLCPKPGVSLWMAPCGRLAAPCDEGSGARPDRVNEAEIHRASVDAENGWHVVPGSHPHRSRAPCRDLQSSRSEQRGATSTTGDRR